MPDTSPAPVSTSADHLDPPTTFAGILRRIGPGMILAGSIVGSGELIATTKTGAEAGFTLLWLIIIGCIIKVFVQIELGRYSIVSGQTTLAALNTVPGPRLAMSWNRFNAQGNWIVWFWLLMFVASIGQLGGIVGGVGQALAISLPLTEDGKRVNQIIDEQVTLKVKTTQLAILKKSVEQHGSNATDDEKIRAEALDKEITLLKPKVAAHAAQAEAQAKFRKTETDLHKLESALAALSERPSDAHFAQLAQLKQDYEKLRNQVADLGAPPTSNDDKYWALIIGVITTIVLTWGRYKLIEIFSIVMVATFTLVTLGNLLALQTFHEWSVKADDLARGLSFGVPAPSVEQKLKGITPFTTALAAFGIIGVGASELMAYPYWCIEKGYAKFTGRNDGSDSWLRRARGWVRVMLIDSLASMILYTIATVAFYLLGAAILNRTGLNPSNDEMIRTLTGMYEPVFGSVAPVLFLVGAFAVLYSTYFSATAANARQAADVIPAFGIKPLDDAQRRRWVRFFSGLFPMLCVAIFVVYPNPVTLILLSGVMQALLLPMLGFAALYYRHKRCDPRLAPGKWWDLLLGISFLAFTVVGVYLTYAKLFA